MRRRNKRKVTKQTKETDFSFVSLFLSASASLFRIGERRLHQRGAFQIDQPPPQGAGNGLSAIPHFELAVDDGQKPSHSTLGNLQCGADLFVALALGEQREHLKFTIG